VADQGEVETICIGGDVGKELIGIDSNSKAAVHDGNEGPEGSRGVDSEAEGTLMLVLASRLHTGQNVLHVLSQESIQNAWNSGKQSKPFVKYKLASD